MADQSATPKKYESPFEVRFPQERHCPACGGLGKKRGARCTLCNGKGKVSAIAAPR